MIERSTWAEANSPCSKQTTTTTLAGAQVAFKNLEIPLLSKWSTMVAVSCFTSSNAIRTDLEFPDEVSALVVDIGSSSVRAGYAGDDTPKAVIPSSYGYFNNPPGGDVSMENGNSGETKSAYSQIFIGQNGPSTWRAGMEIGNPLQDGLSESR